MTGIRSPNARATTSPPKNIEPVSPINTFAGWKFHTKNAQADTSQRCRQQVHLHKAFDGRDDQKAHRSHHRDRGCQPVDAVGQVDRIDRTDDDEQHDRVVEKADVKLPLQKGIHKVVCGAKMYSAAR